MCVNALLHNMYIDWSLRYLLFHIWFVYFNIEPRKVNISSIETCFDSIYERTLEFNQNSFIHAASSNGRRLDIPLGRYLNDVTLWGIILRNKLDLQIERNENLTCKCFALSGVSLLEWQTKNLSVVVGVVVVMLLFRLLL